MRTHIAVRSSCRGGSTGQRGTGGEGKYHNDKQIAGLSAHRLVSGVPFHLVMSKTLHNTRGQAMGVEGGTCMCVCVCVFARACMCVFVCPPCPVMFTPPDCSV